MASNIVYQAVINVLMYFYTDVYGIETAAAGTLMIAVRLFDAVIDPVMGGIADRTRTQWGRYRPSMLWFAFACGILAVTAFITTEVPTGTKLVYAYISYGLLMTAYTAVSIPYSAPAGVMCVTSTITDIRPAAWRAKVSAMRTGSRLADRASVSQPF